VTTAGLYPRTRHLEAKALPAAEGFAAANARLEAVGNWKARRLAVADSMLGTDIAAATIGGNCDALEPAQGEGGKNNEAFECGGIDRTNANSILDSDTVILRAA
jgi:hypothetical protein